MHQERLKRCGILLIILGILNVIFWVWYNTRTYSLPFPYWLYLFEIIAGIFLIRGILQAAKWAAYIGSYLLVSFIGTLLAKCLVFPIGYILANLRLHAHVMHVIALGHSNFLTTGMVWYVTLNVISFLLILWVCKELLNSEVTEAQKAAQIKPPRIIFPIVLGVVISVYNGLGLFAMTHGRVADKAVELAKKQFGEDYHYQVADVAITKTETSHKTFSVLVAAYNDEGFKRFPVNWKE
jgi:hypothetical protein